MGAWGAGIFENDTSLDLLCGHCSWILERIDEVMNGDPVMLEPDEHTFDETLAWMDILVALAKHIRNKPLSLGVPKELEPSLFPGNYPSIATIEAWREKMLSRFDSFYEGEEPWKAKREVLFRVLDDLLDQAKAIEAAAAPACAHIEKENHEYDALPQKEKDRRAKEADDLMDKLFDGL